MDNIFVQGFINVTTQNISIVLQGFMCNKDDLGFLTSYELFVHLGNMMAEKKYEEVNE